VGNKAVPHRVTLLAGEDGADAVIAATTIDTALSSTSRTCTGRIQEVAIDGTRRPTRRVVWFLLRLRTIPLSRTGGHRTQKGTMGGADRRRRR